MPFHFELVSAIAIGTVHIKPVLTKYHGMHIVHLKNIEREYKN